MAWVRRTISLRPRPRGFHLVTDEVLDGLPELRDVRVGLLHVFCRHTSAGLTLNENASPDVRRDLRTWFDAGVPEEFAWTHRLEGPDDMPAHVKTSLIGPELTIPVDAGELLLGTWQGITLGEFRDRGGARELVLTLSGEAD
jgi:secondary thiamine-phosphate synthase enzyme